MADKALLILEKRQVIDVAAREYVPPVELRRTIFGTNVVSVLGSTEITLGICICMRIGVIGDNRGVSRETLLQLRKMGIDTAYITLHAGLSSYLDDELDKRYKGIAEEYHIDKQTALKVGTAHSMGRRVIAVGTTVVRALESAAQEDG